MFYILIMCVLGNGCLLKTDEPVIKKDSAFFLHWNRGAVPFV